MNQTLVITTGSSTDKRKLPYYLFAILHVDEEIRAEMVFYKQKI